MVYGLSRGKQLILFYVVAVTSILVNGIIILIFLDDSPSSVYRFSFSQSTVMDSCIYAVFWLISPVIGFYLSYLISASFLQSHHFVFRKRVTYAFDKRPDPIRFTKDFSRLFFPALMTVNIGLMLIGVPEVQKFFINPSLHENLEYSSLLTLMALIPIISVFSIFSIGIFGGTYFLLDSGVVFTNKNHYTENQMSTVVTPVGSWFMNLLNGYTGIAVVINYYSFLADLIPKINVDSGFASIMMLVLWPAMPFFLLLTYYPFLILLFDKF
ncbi:MAG: hypothetical protein ACFFCS_23270, partial [Candidatus Hodarchaeota archaeon]